MRGVCLFLALTWLANAQGGLDSGPWPTLGHDNQRTSRSTLPGPSVPGTPTIIYDAGSYVGLNQVVVTSDGKILLGFLMDGRTKCTDQLIALNTNGQPLGGPWPYQLMSTTYPSSPETATGVTVASNGTIYVATHECPDIPGPVPTHFYSITSSGTNSANWPIASNAMYYSSAVGADGTIYQMDEFNEVHAYAPEGTLLWTVGLPSFSQGDIALDQDGNLYVGTDATLVGGHAVYSFTSAGAARSGWPQDTGGATAQTTPVIGSNDQVYIANVNGSMFGFNSDGSSIAGFPFNAGGFVSQQPLAISSTGMIYMKTSLGLFAVNPDGSKAWSFAPGGDSSLSPGPVVDSNGSVYVAFGNSVYSLNPDGTVRTGWPVTVPSAGVLVIGGSETLYASSAGQALYAINSGAQTGTITVATNLASAIFTITGPENFSGSGTSTTFNNAPAGAYTITFGSVAGYGTPASQTQTLNEGGSISFSGVYQNLATAPVNYGGPSTASQNGFTNEPINTATGDYYLSHTDLAVPGNGLAFNFTRAYNSLDPYSGPLGVGWTHSFNIFLTASGGTASVKEADGHVVAFNATGGGSYAAATPGVFDTLIQNADSSFTLTRKNQTHFNFSPSGRLTSVVDRNGNTQMLSYDASGNLVSILDSSGRTFTFTSDGNGHIAGMSDPSGRAWQYSYDANGNLASVRDPDGGVTQYGYDANHRMISAADPRGVTFLQNTFDSQGRVVAQANARGFITTLAYGSPGPGITTLTDPLNNATQHVYDGALRLIKVIDAKGGTISYAYDANNNRTSVTNQNSKTTTFAYDANGNVTTVTDPLGDTTSFTYDSKNDLTSATSPSGNTSTFSYDTNGNLIALKDPLGDTTAFGYNSAGLPATKMDARGNTTAFSYDGPGDLVGITDALGNSTALAYDGVGRLTSVTDAKNHKSSVTYDALGRIVSVTDPLGNQTQFAYDPAGNLLKIADANGHATSYAYDGTNNLTAVTDATGHVTHYAYDANNNRTGFTNAKGNTTSYAYDPLNRLSQITDALLFVTGYAYDPMGNVVSTTDANGKTNQFSYDPLNRLTSIAYADRTNVLYSYDTDGNRISMTDPHGATSYTYDGLNRLIAVTNPGGQVVRYAYDAIGNRDVLIYPDGKTVTYAYDRANRLAGATDWLGRTTTYSHDAVGNLVQTTYPNHAGVRFAYDAANRLTQVVNSTFGLPLLKFNYTLDHVGNRTALSVDGLTTTFAYDPLNELVSAKLGPLQTTWTYDALGNRLAEASPTGTIAYTYDADDRLVSAGATSFSFDPNGSLISKTGPWGRVNYAYDTANRLIGVTGPGVNSSFGYDGDGNRIAQTTAAGAYTYVNDVNTSLPVVLSEQGPDGFLTYAYGQGLIEEYSPSFNYFYHFDGLGSIVALTDAKGLPAAAYAYDPWGNALLTVTDKVGTRNKFRFTGEALDPGTGLYYLRARYYDAGTGDSQLRILWLVPLGILRKMHILTGYHLRRQALIRLA